MSIEKQMTLASLRKRINMTQADVSKVVGVSKETIMRWEKDATNMPLKYMFVFSKLYKYPIDGIFFGNSITFSDNLKATEVVK